MSRRTPNGRAADLASGVAAELTELGFPVDTADIEVLRRSHNLTFATGDSVVRLMLSPRDPSVLQREISLVEGLTSAGFSTPALQTKSDIVETRAGKVLIFERIRHAVQPNSGERTGTLIRRFHDVARDLNIDWPEWEPFHRLPSRLKGARERGLDKAREDSLLSLVERTRERLSSALSNQELGVVHGDAHTGNMLQRGNELWLLDFEEAGWGPIAFDIVPAAIAVKRFGADPSSLNRFLQAYGLDEPPPHFATLVEVKQIMMISWLLEMWGSDSAVNSQVDLRLASFDDSSVSWAAR